MNFEQKVTHNREVRFLMCGVELLRVVDNVAVMALVGYCDL